VFTHASLLPVHRWTLEETREFFRCLQMCGADFSMLEEVLQVSKLPAAFMLIYVVF
jgi:Myb DNA-binding like